MIQNDLTAMRVRRLALLLRAGIALCFIGHGVFGLLRKPAWTAYFALFGIGESTALLLMPLVGTLDIAVGVLAFVAPSRALLAYAAFWSLFTAALRPLNGEQVAQMLERAGNYGVPLALLAWAGVRSAGSSARGWLVRIRATQLEPHRMGAVLRICQWTTALLLGGHGMLALGGDPLLVQHLGTIGAQGIGVRVFGVLELALAAACIARPAAPLFGVIVGWKLATESLFLVSGAPIWEFVERGGSYVAPLVVAMLLATTHSRAPDVIRAARRRPALSSRRSHHLAAPIASIALLAGGLTLWPADGAARQTRPPGGRPPQQQPRPQQAAGERVAAPAYDAAAAQRLRRGGYVLACRHGITDHNAVDRSPLDFADPATQRVLNRAGELQMRDAGARVARANIPIGAVLTSPYLRTRHSAELMFGHAAVEDALYGTGKEARLRALFHERVRPGTNRVLMTHQGILYRMLPVPRGSIQEGDCVMVEPTGTSLRVMAHIAPDAW